MTLVHPEALVLLVLLPVAWLWPRRPQDVGEGLTRSLLLLGLVLALARPVQRMDQGPPHVALLVDRTASVAPMDLPTLEFPPGTRVTRVELEGEDTPLAAGLARAAAAIPDGSAGAVVLASDGLATAPNWARATQDIVARGLPVHVLPRAVPADDLRPVSIEPQGELRVGQVARVAVTVLGNSEAVTIRLLGGGGELASAEVPLSGRARVLLEFEPAEAGWLEVTVEVSGRDAQAGNESLTRTLAVQDPLRVLYLGQNTRGGADRLGELLGAGFEIAEGRATSPELAASDVVLIDDLPAGSMDEGAQAALAEAVVGGGLGLVMSGAGSFGPGGWHDTPVMDLLPVESVQKEEKRDPSTTLVVILDTSGSMGGNRVQLAKEVSRLAIQRLLPHDKVGIVEFFGAKRWAAPIQPASNRIELERALNRLNAGGGTVILPAIEEAFYGLQNVQTRYKHVLVLTDGGVERGSFESLIRRMADEGITVSTVLIGPDAHSEFLVSIANWGKGRFYSVPNRFNLPEVLLKQPTSAKLPAWREGEHVLRARGGAGWWGNVDPTAVPALAGYVETKARPGAQVLLETERGAHPVLATWRPGLGRTTALTTGPTGRGSEPWSGWEAFGAALGRVLTRTASEVRMPYTWSVERRGHEVLIVAERMFFDAPTPRAELEGGLPLPLIERAPGRYEGRLVRGTTEEVRVTGRAGTARIRLVLPPIGAETQIDPRSGLDLEALALASGGRLLEGRGVVPISAGSGDVGLRDWRPACLLLSLIALLVNIAWRRRPRP